MRLLPPWLLAGRDLFVAQKPSASQPVRRYEPAVATSTRSYEEIPGWTWERAINAPIALEVFDSLVAGIPILDVGLRKLTRLITPFDVVSDNEATKQSLDEWLEQVRVSQLFTGWDAFANPYVRQMLQYGKAAGEVVLAANGTDVPAVEVIDSKRITLVNKDRQLLIGEKRFGTDYVYPDQDLFVYTAWNRLNDGPHGRSLLHCIPWVADILFRILTAVRQKWQRHGAPSFMVQLIVPQDSTIKATDLATYRTAIQTEWVESMRARWNNEGIIDFFAASDGEVKVQALGDGQELEFSAPYRSLLEQIIATVELAPFMLGISWASTERMSQHQADAIVAQVESCRAQLKPDFLSVLDWVARARNLRGTIEIKWRDVNLLDRSETARADLIAAQAQKQRTENAVRAWQLGWWDQERAAEEAGYELEKIDRALDEPPAAQAQGPANAGMEPVDPWNPYTGIYP